MTVQDLPVVLHNDNRGLLTIEEGKLDVLQLSPDGRPPKCLLSVPTRLVLRARVTEAVEGKPRRLELHALGQKGSKSTTLHLRKIHVLVEPPHHAEADEWVEQLMLLAYPVTKPFRRVLLLVNPVGGKGKARSIVKDQVQPLLEAAGCKVDKIETTHSKHAEEIASSLDVSHYDVIATASGDGNVYEILNGLALRPDARRALRIPIAPLPTGSACAASTNLFGVKDTFNMALATLNVIKGQPLPVDLCSVLLMPSGERRVSFLSTALGLMVDLDIGTEHLRWMGDSRFMYGFLRGVAQNKPCKARLTLDVITDDKEEMARVARQAAAQEVGVKAIGGGTDPLALVRGLQTPASQTIAVNDVSGTNGVANGNGSLNGSASLNGNGSLNGSMNGNGHVNGDAKTNGDKTEEEDDGPLPPAHPLQPTADWLVVDSGAASKKSPNGSRATSLAETSPNTTTKHGNWVHGESMLYMYAGLMPWVSRDLNQWPVIRNGSGAIDVVIQRLVPRRVLLNAITSAEHGDAFWEDCQHYYKVRGFIAENLDKANQPMFTIDGEGFPWDTFHVEVLPRAATFLSLDGRFYHSRFVSTSNGEAEKRHKQSKTKHKNNRRKSTHSHHSHH